MRKSISCATCGAKFRSHRLRCPRCRSFVETPDLVAEAASSRRLTRVAASITALLVAVVGFLWITRGAPPKEVPAESRAASTAPRSAPPQSTALNGPSSAQPGAAFLDPSGAAAIAYRAGDYQTALAEFQAAIEKNPNDAEALSNLGQVLVRLGRTSEAVPFLQRSTTLNPDRWAYRFNLARALGLLGQWAESIASYRYAQRLFPNDYVTTFNLALALHKAGDEAGAVEQYRRAIELHPEDPSFRMALGISYERLEQPALAVAAYSEYLRLSPSAPDADKVRARIARLAGTGGPSSATMAVPSGTNE